MIDFTINDQGTIVMVTPVTQEARDWVDANVVGSGSAQPFAVEPRMVPVLASGIEADGLSIEEG